ncbi:thioredoxin [Blastomyces percursus]|uniref:Thioredoxin n=1 Tax=Blastomyces percursus TaxID=1658174 RepID=A0A1J9QEG8_9EURO|nr:thioredoxin [Blastomyces percursus]
MLPKTSLSRALVLRTVQRGGGGHHVIHPQQPLQPLFTSSTTTLPSTPLRLYNSPAPTVASFRPLSSFLRTSTTTKTTTTTSISASSTSTLLSTRPIRNNPSATPLLQQPSSGSSNKRSFTSSARSSFTPTAGTMVVHNLRDRASFDSAVASTTAASTASTGEPPKPLIVVDCFATWCGPCKAIAPKLVEFSDAYPNVGFYKVDVDECPDIAQELGVRAMPTFILFKDGQKVDEVLGAVPQAIEAAISKHLS